jgi:predicted transcriptional regulator
MNINAHPATLEGKTVVLRANGKHNSDRVLERVGELLQKEVKNVKIVRLWEVYPESNVISQGPELSQQIAAKIATYNPGLVIGSSSD